MCNVIIMVLLASLTFSITKAGDRADCTVLFCVANLPSVPVIVVPRTVYKLTF